MRVQKNYQATLSLDPLRDDPELVGQEIRSHIINGRLREKRCVICVPLRWAFSLRTDLRNLPETDTDSYLAIQAERGFAVDPQELSMAVSKFCDSSGRKQATIVGIPTRHVLLLEKALKAAGLRPVSVTLGATSLVHDEKDADEGKVLLSIGEEGMDLLVRAGGGVVSLRTLQDIYVDRHDREQFNVPAILRHLRITLGQLTHDLRNEIKTVQIFGPRNLVEKLADDLQNEAHSINLKVEPGRLPLNSHMLKSETGTVS